MKNVIESIEKYIEEYENEAKEIADLVDDDFNPCDASGGNFDDAYYMGMEHGEVYGKLEMLQTLQEIIKRNMNTK